MEVSDIKVHTVNYDAPFTRTNILSKDLEAMYNSSTVELPQLPDEYDIKKMYNLTGPCENERAGTYNTNCNYHVNGKNISYRISTDPFFLIRRKKLHIRGSEYVVDVNEDMLSINTPKEVFINNLAQSKSNWLRASELNISPKVYFYGFVKRLLEPDTYTRYTWGIYAVIISEAYDMDLHSYYAYGPGEIDDTISEVDKEICTKLVFLLDKLHHSMSLICYDIKPGNCVINIHNNDVRLIDWDGDWCRQYPFLTRGSLVDRQSENAAILSHVFMANHFYMLGKNIFVDYFQNNLYNVYGRDIITDRRAALETIFCSLSGETGNDISSRYMLLARHYFKIAEKDCKKIFTEIMARSHILKKTAGGQARKHRYNYIKKRITKKHKSKKSKKNKKSKKSQKKRPRTKKL